MSISSLFQCLHKYRQIIEALIYNKMLTNQLKTIKHSGGWCLMLKGAQQYVIFHTFSSLHCGHCRRRNWRLHGAHCLGELRNRPMALKLALIALYNRLWLPLLKKQGITCRKIRGKQTAHLAQLEINMQIRSKRLLWRNDWHSAIKQVLPSYIGQKVCFDKWRWSLNKNVVIWSLQSSSTSNQNLQRTQKSHCVCDWLSVITEMQLLYYWQLTVSSQCWFLALNVLCLCNIPP